MQYEKLSPAEIAADVVSIQRIEAIPALLQVLCDLTGMGLALVARVEEDTWTACAVVDHIQFGLGTGEHLDIRTTLCRDVRAARSAISIDDVELDPRYRDHPTPALYGFSSYISVPIILSDNRYFGNLCAVDPKPALVCEPRIQLMFHSFARLIAQQIELNEAHEQERNSLLNKQAVANMRGLFMAMLAHDLRDPIEQVNALGREWGKTASNPAQRSMTDRLKTQTDRMLSVLEDSLYQARQGPAEGLPVRVRQIGDLSDNLTEMVANLRAAHPGRRIISHIRIDQLIHCDAERIRQMAHNLLLNALIHGLADGPVSFVATVDGAELVVQVWNDGNPLSTTALKKVFDPFWRQHPKSTGPNLGLHMCSEIVRAHSGRLVASSSPTDGTLFVARIPVNA